MINLEKIKEQVSQVISWSQDLTTTDLYLDKIFQKWQENKQHFIDLFGGELIYEAGEVQFELDQSEKDKQFNKFISYVRNNGNNDELADFLVRQGVNALFDNSVRKIEEDRPDIKVGMKLLKSFKYFESSEGLLRIFQDKASELIQSNKVCGTLCFSVHPLDYLSLSETTYNWRSCHALDGEYRVGNLAYMQDYSTMICYLRGADGVILPRFAPSVPWNAKKWRMLLFVNEAKDFIFAGRQYPFFSKDGLQEVYEKFVQELIVPSKDYPFWMGDPHKMWSKWMNFCLSDNININDEEYSLVDKYIYYDSQILPIDSLMKEPNSCDVTYFNDLTRSSFYTPYYCWDTYYLGGRTKKETKMQIGEQVDCVLCGDHLVADSDTFLCDYCFDRVAHGSICDMCGNMSPTTEWYEDFNQYLCANCRDHIEICPACGNSYWAPDGVYSKLSNEWLCPACGRLEAKGTLIYDAANGSYSIDSDSILSRIDEEISFFENVGF